MSHIRPDVGGSRKRSSCEKEIGVVRKEWWRLSGGWDYYFADVFEGVEFGGEAAVDTEELFVHDGC